MEECIQSRIFSLILIIIILLQTLVAETCANLLRFTLPLRSLSFALSDTQAGATPPPSLAGMPLGYRPERLPNVLTKRLESIAQYAPFAIQSLYHDAYSATGGVTHSYGVFDGLDHSHVPLVGSPVRSPHKVASSMYSPQDAVPFALPSVQDGEEDEF